MSGVLNAYFDQGLVYEDSVLNDIWLALSKRARDIAKEYLTVRVPLEVVLGHFPTLYGIEEYGDLWDEPGMDFRKTIADLRSAAAEVAPVFQSGGKIMVAPNDKRLLDEAVGAVKRLTERKRAYWRQGEAAVKDWRVASASAASSPQPSAEPEGSKQSSAQWWDPRRRPESMLESVVIAVLAGGVVTGISFGIIKQLL